MKREMYIIRKGNPPIPEEKAELFYTAAIHLQEIFRTYPERTFLWIKSKMTNPSFSDLIFSYKNAIFAVLPLATDNNSILYPDDDRMLKSLLRMSAENDLIPCIFPVHENAEGWNLFDAAAFTENKLDPIDPIHIGTDDEKKMSSWEMHDFAVQTVMRELEAQGKKIESYQTIPGIDPQIFFRDDDGKLSWITVRWFPYGKEEYWNDEFIEMMDRNISSHPEYSGYPYRASVLIHMPQSHNPARGSAITIEDPVIRKQNISH